MYRIWQNANEIERLGEKFEEVDKQYDEKLYYQHQKVKEEVKRLNKLQRD